MYVLNNVDYALIDIGNNVLIIVDNADVPFVLSKPWGIKKYSNTSYVAYREYTKGTKESVGRYLHRELTKCPKGLVVDHINGNGLDNRRCNLRICTVQQNVQNQRHCKKSTNKYKGTTFIKKRNKWAAQIQANRIYYFLGHYTLAEDAAKAYNEAALKYHGEFAVLNKIEECDGR